MQSLEATANRTTRVGRFTVSVQGQGKVEFSAAHPVAGGIKREESFGVNRSHSRKRLGLLPWQRQVLIAAYHLFWKAFLTKESFL